MANGFYLSYRSSAAAHRQVLWTEAAGTPPAIPAFSPQGQIILPLSNFKQQLVPLHLGRFYPARVLTVSQNMPGDMFRVIGLDALGFRADFNHPLAQVPVESGSVQIEGARAGATPAAELLRWGGIELPPAQGATDFQDADAFAREDEAADDAFYATPRKLLHVDAVCAQRIVAFYASHLAPQDTVLDLMAAWRSHLPPAIGPVTGLGMNAEEMSDNPHLQTRLCHDLNAQPQLPFEDARFDAVVNSVSFEYLTQPLAVLREVRRILKPQGKLLITFSNRFFPPKAIMLWKRLHPVERLAWVVQCAQAAGFQEIETLVERGLQRDPGDRYAQQFKEMDPLFAVSAHSPVAGN